MSAAVLAKALRDPGSMAALDDAGWNGLIAAARAERLIGTLAVRALGMTVPKPVQRIFVDARREAEREKRQALWEADRAAAALVGFAGRVVMLKGTAYVAAGLGAGEGRFIGDLDILVPRTAMADAERRLIAAGWEWVKQDAYDDAYYRQWMHELPPLIHRDRDRMIDVHHTILPLTAKPKPDAAAMLADAVPITIGLYILSPEDRVCHAVAHLLADGDLAGGMRNLWDIHCLLEEADQHRLANRASRHGIAPHVRQAQRLAQSLYGPARPRLSIWDRLILLRLLARDGWGRETRKFIRFSFYIRSHWLRMPPVMLARHLLTKWRKGHRPT